MKKVNNMLVLGWEEVDVYFGGEGPSSHFESARCEHFPVVKDCPHCGNSDGDRYSIPSTKGIGIPIEILKKAFRDL